jgi:hypothetical protein
VDDNTTGCHPLQVARTDDSFVSCKVLMLNLSHKHVGHSLETTMGVVRVPTGGVRVKLIEHEERVVVAEFGSTDGTPDHSTDTLGLFLGENKLYVERLPTQIYHRNKQLAFYQETNNRRLNTSVQQTSMG